MGLYLRTLEDGGAAYATITRRIRAAAGTYGSPPT